MISLSVSEASRHFLDLVRRVCSRGEEALLMEGGAPVVRVVPAGKIVTGASLAASWPSALHLDVGEADEFARELDAARTALPKVSSKWE